MAKQDYAAAEAAFQAAAKLDPSSAEPYNAMANLYNAQKKFDQAAAMTAEALKRGGGSAGGGSPETMFNQGVTLWNAGKIAEAKAQFEAATKAKPDYAEAHYWIGMANLNEGKMPEAVDVVRDLREARADRPVRRAGQEDAPADQAAVSAVSLQVSQHFRGRASRARPRPISIPRSK